MPARPRLTRGLLAALAFVGAVGPLATDLYLASFTDIASELGAPAASVQLTLTAFLLGLGVGQLVLGPLSDQLGRRPVLVTAMGVFAASSIALAFTPGIELFIALRAVQGIAGASGMVIARAIVVDLAEGAAAVRAISLLVMLTSLGPLIAPPLGGVILTLGDWRAVLGVLAAAATAMFALAAALVPESLPPEQRTQAGMRTTLRSFGVLLRDARFVALVGIFALGFGSMMAYISASPFVGQLVLGMSALHYSLGFAAGATALILMNLLNAQLAGRVPAKRMLLIGCALVLGAGIALSALSVTGALSPPLFIACAFVLSGGAGLIMSNGSALALLRAGAHRGAASALLGAAQFAVGGLASPLVGAWGEHTAVPMALFVLAASALAFAGALAFRGRA
ncbi:multidrug effflux MFS transporter [Leucobacter massiliensis]|uniref:Major facilitator superfamily (MFS) profile domain-containing protein n=1 Tax=Leucobacter massiliensis TaxID=1686285 RepID=A0A2S9QPQ7_9MICO|nr:multidrug effflux MFS transporter [Leucobacter massiliensis]PRI11581.1 hypothetical protein B4915_05530 [Leucobacter massiliensis]